MAYLSILMEMAIGAAVVSVLNWAQCGRRTHKNIIFYNVYKINIVYITKPIPINHLRKLNF